MICPTYVRDGVNRTVGSRPYQLQAMAQVVGYWCWLLPKLIYIVTDKQLLALAPLRDEIQWWVLMNDFPVGPPTNQSAPFILWGIHSRSPRMIGSQLRGRCRIWSFMP